MVRPGAYVLDGKLAVTGGGAEQEISEAISSVDLVVALERECAQRRSKELLLLLVKRPAPTDFDLMRAFRPGDVVANLVTVSGIDPRPAGGLEVRIALLVEGDVGNAVHGIRSREEPSLTEVAWYGACRAIG